MEPGWVKRTMFSTKMLIFLFLGICLTVTYQYYPSIQNLDLVLRVHSTSELAGRPREALLPPFLKNVYPVDFETDPKHRRTFPRPYVTLTYAQSLDGRVAGPGGISMPLSGNESFTMTNWIRTLHDGILIGINTLLYDDPSLSSSSRFLSPRKQPYCNPTPIVLDTTLKTPINCKLIKRFSNGTGIGMQPFILAGRPPASSGNHPTPLELWDQRRYALEVAGAKVLDVGLTSENSSRVDLYKALSILKNNGIHALMIEGGASVIASFITMRDGNRSVIDMHLVTVSPMMIGKDGYEPISYLNMSQVPVLKPVANALFGKDAVLASLVE